VSDDVADGCDPPALNGNRLRALPEGLALLPASTSLSVEGNPVGKG
jgi:hypothetical protein